MSEGPPAAEDLVIALGHEVGNLMAATRLHAYLLGDGAPPESGDDPRSAISQGAARGGSLLALLRPLLAPASLPSGTLAPLDVLDALQREIEEPGLERVELDLRSSLELPAVRAPSDVLHNLLLTAVFGGLEVADAPASVSVGAERRGDRVAFRVDYRDADARGGEADIGGRLCGRPLEWACARRILQGLGGDVELERAGGRTRVSYLVPLA